MKYFLMIFLTLYVTKITVAQFADCNNTYVVAFKEGTSCTASPYNFHTINIADGSISATPFFQLLDNTKEVNGFGINSNDLKLYGIVYDRSAGCVFSNFRVFKLEGGVMVDMGAIAPPTDGVNTGTIEGAFGCISLNGDLIIRANINIGGTFYSKIGKISQLQNLTPQALITPTYTTITSSFTGRNYADWAIHPINGDLYTYTIQTGASGVATNGQMAKLDLTTMSIDLIGNITTGEFLDALRDNFGGIMFGDNNKMYGVNVNTRKLYEINISDGTTTYLNTIPSAVGGQIRTDLGSCRNGNFLLSLNIESFSGYRNNGIDALTLVTSKEENITSIEIENSIDGYHFNKIKNLTPYNSLHTNTYSVHLGNNNATTYYRVKIVSGTKVQYSKILKLSNLAFKNNFVATSVSVSKQNFAVTLAEGGLYSVQYYTSLGQIIFTKNIFLQKGVQNVLIDKSLNSGGLINATITKQNFKKSTTFIVN